MIAFAVLLLVASASAASIYSSEVYGPSSYPATSQMTIQQSPYYGSVAAPLARSYEQTSSIVSQPVYPAGSSMTVQSPYYNVAAPLARSYEQTNVYTRPAAIVAQPTTYVSSYAQPVARSYEQTVIAQPAIYNANPFAQPLSRSYEQTSSVVSQPAAVYQPSSYVNTYTQPLARSYEQTVVAQPTVYNANPYVQPMSRSYEQTSVVSQPTAVYNANPYSQPLARSYEQTSVVSQPAVYQPSSYMNTYTQPLARSYDQTVVYNPTVSTYQTYNTPMATMRSDSYQTGLVAPAGYVAH